MRSKVKCFLSFFLLLMLTLSGCGKKEGSGSLCRGNGITGSGQRNGSRTRKISGIIAGRLLLLAGLFAAAYKKMRVGIRPWRACCTGRGRARHGGLSVNTRKPPPGGDGFLW